MLVIIKSPSFSPLGLFALVKAYTQEWPDWITLSGAAGTPDLSYPLRAEFILAA